MKIIVGLGNPGKKYAKTRHNMGFLAIDILAQKLDIKVKRIGFLGKYGHGVVNGEKIMLLKPSTYMNDSGSSVNKAMKYYKCSIEDVLVIYDDIDLPVGKLRIRKKGSGGTHNGMRSIIQCIQKDNFPRARVGIGRPKQMGRLVNFVLDEPAKSEREPLFDALVAAAAAALMFMEAGIEPAMQEYNK